MLASERVASEKCRILIMIDASAVDLKVKGKYQNTERESERERDI
jgi:hypothetical protein